MNKSFDGGQSAHYLPPISRTDSTNNPKARRSYYNLDRSQSHHEITPVGNLNTTPITRKLIET